MIWFPSSFASQRIPFKKYLLEDIFFTAFSPFFKGLELCSKYFNLQSRNVSSLLPISVADVKIDWVLGKMVKSYKTTEQSIKEGLGIEARSTNVKDY